MFGKWHLGMYKEAYTPRKRGFDEHMGYYQGCGSQFTHVAACCTAGTPDHDQNFICNVSGKYGEWRGYDWFKSGAYPNSGVSKPDLSANHTRSVPGSWVGARRRFHRFCIPYRVPHGSTPRS